MPGLGGGSPCCGELVLNLRASSTRGRGLTARSSREDGRSPLWGGTGSQGRLLSLAGFSHLPSGLYPSYLHLNHLEPPSSGSPLLSQLGQPSIFDTQKGQRAGVAGKPGGGLWNGIGGNYYPSTPDHHPGCVSQDASPERPPQAPGAHP